MAIDLRYSFPGNRPQSDRSRPDRDPPLCFHSPGSSSRAGSHREAVCVELQGFNRYVVWVEIEVPA